MSWFGARTPSTPDPAGHAIDNGVLLERRVILRLTLGTIAILGWYGNARSELCSPHNDENRGVDHTAKLPWDAFISEVMPLARALVGASQPDEDCYLQRLDTLLWRLANEPGASLEHTSPIEAASLFEKYPVVVRQFRFLPGAEIRCHDHREYNGILKVTAGHLRVRTFEHVSSTRPARGETFSVRETGNHLLGTDDRSCLSRSRNNIHYLRAQSDGAVVLDVFTFFEEGAGSNYLDIEGVEDCADCVGREYKARWAE